MTWSLFDYCRRLVSTPAPKTRANRKTKARRWQPQTELLEDRTVPSVTSVLTSNFNSTAIASGSTVWFNSAINVTGVGTNQATVNVTNQKITFSDTKGGVTTAYTVNVPDAVITVSASASSATTTYSSSLNQWQTTVPVGLSGNEFMSGAELVCPSGLGGGDTNVKWSADFSTDTTGLTISWEWGAAVYTSFNTSYAGLGVKPCDSSTASSYSNSDHAGTPESYKLKLTGGGTGSGSGNYTGNYSSMASVTPTVVNGFISGIVYNDLNGNGQFGSTDPGLSGWTVQLYTQTNGTLSGTPLKTTTSDALGGYTFSGLGSLASGTSYVVAEVLPSGWTQTSPSASSSNVTTLPSGQKAYLYPISDGNLLLHTSSGNTDVSGTGTLVWTSNNAAVSGKVSANDGAGNSMSNASTTFGQMNITFTPAGGSALSFYSYCMDLFHDVSTNQSVSVYVSGNESTAFVNGSRMEYIYEMYGAANLSGNSAQAAAVQLALWDLSLNNHNPTSFSVDADGTYSSGDESVYSVTFNSTSDANAIAPLVDQYLKASIGATVQGAWFNAAANGTGSTRGQSMPMPSPWFTFGAEQPVTIAGTVYEDSNYNGAKDSGEPGISGVTLTLSGTNGAGQSITATTTTGSDGSYSFTTDSGGNKLMPGTYAVTETVPSGYTAVAANVGTVSGSTDGTVTSSTKISSVVLTSNQSGSGYNFGDVRPVTLAGTVYNDGNANGVLDSGEPVISGVTITLTGTNGKGQSVTATTTTAANGTYSFTKDSSGNNLLPGTYQIAETQPSNYLQGLNSVGTVNGTTDGVLVPTDKIGSIVLASNQGGVGYNFGEVQPVTISGTVYLDATGAGTLTPTAAGVAGVTITLTGTNILGQSVTATTTTSSTGTYAFSTDSSGNVLWPGSYTLTETQPSGYLSGSNSVGTALGTPGSSTINWSQDYQSVVSGTDTSGAGTTPGFVHDPVNSTSDNIFTGGNSKDTSGIGQWQWTLQKPQNKDDIADVLSSTYVDSTTGHKIVLMSMDRFSSNGDTTAGFWFLQNSVSGKTGGTFSGVHTDGDILVVADFAGSGSSAVSVYRWTGSDSTGSLVAYTPPSGSVYFFVNSSGQSVPWSFTDSSGFSSPQSGEFIQLGLDYNAIFGTNEPRFQTILAETRSSNSTSSTLSDLVVGKVNALTPAGTVSGTLSGSTTITAITLTSNQNGVNYNFGEVQPVTFAGTVYEDKNNNGVINTGEPGIAGATVTLTGTNNLGQSVTATTTSSSTGTYSFTVDSGGNKLAPGTYTITETVPTGYVAGTNAVGTVNGTTDGSLQSGNAIGSIVMISGQSAINYNFANLKTVTISGTVYEDKNNNGVFNTGEPGIAGVTLTLTGTNDLGQSVTGTTTTGPGGTYTFSSDSSGNVLRPGTYQVVETVPTGYFSRAATVGTVNAVADGTASSATTIGSIVLSEGQSGINYYFGDIKAVTVAGTVYEDSNDNSTLNIGEPGVSGVTLTLSGTNDLGASITATTTTASDGTYSFTVDSGGTLLRPGTYQVVESVPSGYLARAANLGTVNGTATGTVSTTSKIISIALAEGQAGINYNFGDIKPITLAGTVYEDKNDNGTFDSGESGISGVTLTLTGTNDLGSLTSATTTTGANGTYSFTTDSGGNVLRPGTYQIAETLPSGYLAVVNSVGTVNGTTDGTLLAGNKIGSIVMAEGQGGINYNFGDVKPITVGGTVYEDKNGNGVFDSGEPVISGVTLSLSGTNGRGTAVTATATTNASGVYTFTVDSTSAQLLPGTYSVTETLPTGYLAGQANVGTVSGTTDGTVTSATKISSIVFTSGQGGINYNFGNVKPITLAGTVYEDKNDNGSLDSGEPGISGVTLSLSGTNNLGQSVTATTTTGSGGTYSFTVDSGGNKLAPGTYQIVETQPAGYLLGQASVGTVNGSSDGTATSATKISSIALTSGQSGVSYNFGDLKAVTLAGTVYEDKNGNNLFDSGESGLSGVTLTLSGTNDQGASITATTTTGSGGAYSFAVDSGGNALRPGTYTITETVPSGYLTGASAVGTVNGTADGTASSATVIGSIVMAEGQSGVNYNFGDLKAVSLSGQVYHDTNANNAQDSGEPGLSGVTLTLSGTNGLGQSITATTTTGSGGAYSFTVDSNGNALRPGTYAITETLPSGYLAGAASVGTVNAALDGTVSSATKISSIALTSGQGGINYNFGEYKAVTLAGLVYQDTNGNNALDGGETGISGVTLSLSGTNNLGQSITATTTTAADGTYSFTVDSSTNALRPGTYTITETVPTGYLAGAATLGTVNGSANGSVTSATKISTIVETSGQSGINYNFGDYQGVTLAGTVYEDKNDNGSLDSGEPGISGVTLTLSGTNGLGQSVTATTTTGVGGTYSFTVDSGGNKLRPGTYSITETQPAGYLLGQASVGTVNGSSDGTATSATKISSIALTSGQGGVSYNFGDLKAVTLAGTVYEDKNGNNLFDAGESGISGVTLTLSGTNDQGASVSATTTTGAGGAYSFTLDSGGNALRPGTYTITETVPSGYLTGAAAVGTVNGSADGTASSATVIGSIVMAEGQSGVNYNFGDLKAVTLGGLVYDDTNGNGLLNTGEPGISGVTLTLTGTNGLGQSITATTTTGSNGAYSFTVDSNGNALRPGTYAITESQPSGYLQGTNAVGTVNGTADGSLVATDQIGSIALTSGQGGVNYNFGEVRAITLSGLVYLDTNANNALDNGESGLSGVTLTLTGTNGLGQSVTAITTSGANGTYSFTVDSNNSALRPGTYTITETVPSGYQAGAASVGTVNGSSDGTLTSATKVSSIVVTSGQSGINYNFGDYQGVTLAGTVYEDKNDNGSLDSGEPGISGVTLSLSGTNNLGQSVTATTTTGSGGAYSFALDSNGNGLRPGTYTITETLPNGYLTGAANVGTVNGTSDGSVLSATGIGSIALTSGQGGVNYNFGDLKAVSVAGLVYRDVNGNNAQDSGEPGMTGVTLTLSGTNDLGQSVTATTTTGSGGAYSFALDSNGNGLRPGTYQITETHPAGYTPGATSVGTVGGTADGSVVSSGTIGSIVMAEGQAGVNYNFGEIPPITLSGTVYIDSNGNGTLDSGEPGLSGVIVTLTGTNNQGQSISVTTTTAADGTYSFSDDGHGNVLRPGTYTITETAPDGYLAGTTSVGTVNGSADGTLVSSGVIGTIVVSGGQNGVNYNFGEWQPVTISGEVYNDASGDGLLSSGETGFSGVTVTLTGTNGKGQTVTVSAVTDANGNYSFSQDGSGNVLLPGTYQVVATKPDGYVFSGADVGTVNGVTDGTEAAADTISSIIMTSGQNGINYDFGLAIPAAVSGYVYKDFNRDQVRDTGDGAFAGVTVTLVGTDNLGNSVSQSVTTDSSGYYIFTGLSAGDYSLVVTPPSGIYTPNASNVGTINGSPVGEVGSETEIDAITLLFAQTGLEYDFGMVQPIG